jgi:hypothetical protein
MNDVAPLTLSQRRVRRSPRARPCHRDRILKRQAVVCFPQRAIPLVERATKRVGVLDCDELARGRERSDVRAANACLLPRQDEHGHVAGPVASASARTAALAWSTSSLRPGAVGASEDLVSDS